MAPQPSTVVNGFTLDLGADDFMDEGRERTLAWPTVATSKLFDLAVITTLPALPQGALGA